MTRNIPIALHAIKPYDVELNMPFAISKGALARAHNILIRITDINGLQGIGEAAPFPVLTHDTPQSALAAVTELCSRLSGLDPMNALSTLYDKHWKEFKATPTARTGVEMALWDLRARQLGVPLAWLWGVACREGTQTDITLPIMPQREVARFHDRFGKHGFTQVKVKVGGESAREDADRVIEVMRLWPAGTQLSLDGNQGCTVESALALLDRLQERNVVPEFFEQPVAADDWAGMVALTARSPVPICADETVRTTADAVRVVRERAAHMINLKFMKSGIIESLRITSIAQAAGLELMIGGMVESEVAMTASLHAYCGTGEIKWCDLDTPFFFCEPLTETNPYSSQSAELRLPSGSGLGLTLRDTFAP